MTKPFVAFLILSICTLSVKAKTGQKPNVIIILADDLGYCDLGCYGNEKARTPHIDKLAREGLRFLDFHSNGTVCSPTRASLLTGKYPQSVGISGVITAKSHRHTGLDTSEILLPEILKKQGYKTGITGKWHLGYDTAYSPVRQGFDTFRGYTSGNVDYISHIDQENHFDWWFNTNKSVEEGYTTDLITGHSVSFIEENRNHPFFLLIAHEAPHSPYQVRESPALRGAGTGEESVPTDSVTARYGRMIEIMDEGVGKVMATLEKYHLTQNTLVLFLSDNGANQNGSNLPYRGNKGQVWEGGHRVPAVAYWKGTIHPGASSQQLMTMDIFPTICGLTAAVIPPGVGIEGESFGNILSGKTRNMEERPLYWSFGKAGAIRKGKWKLVNDNGKRFLFDLDADPGENNNVYEKYPARANPLEELLEKWRKKMARIPQKS